MGWEAPLSSTPDSLGAQWHRLTHGLRLIKHPDPGDRRACVLVLTPAGQRALADTCDWYEQLLTRALIGWTDAEVTALRSGLDRFTSDIEHALGHHNSLEEAR